jgi:predicted RNA-binding Zn ribbon-like protein
MEAANRGAMGTDLELCLDFTDTVDWRTSNHAKDTLDSYAALLEWSSKKRLLDVKEVSLLSRVAAKEDLAPVLAEAVRLREAIYRIFSAIAHEKKAARKDLEILNEYLAKSLSRMAVKETEEGYEWGLRCDASPEMMLYQIAESAAMLLTSEELSRVKECANEEEGCGSLFLDCSKSQTRMWCSMKSCGNRAKSRAFYDRHIRAK